MHVKVLAIGLLTNKITLLIVEGLNWMFASFRVFRAES